MPASKSILARRAAGNCLGICDSERCAESALNAGHSERSEESRSGLYGAVFPMQSEIPRSARNDISWCLGARRPTGMAGRSENCGTGVLPLGACGGERPPQPGIRWNSKAAASPPYSTARRALSREPRYWVAAVHVVLPVAPAGISRALMRSPPIAK